MIQIITISVFVFASFGAGLLLGSYLVRTGIDTAQRLRENQPLFEDEGIVTEQETT
jgi:uncharacterized protein YneF (UPF0154 family)